MNQKLEKLVGNCLYTATDWIDGTIYVNVQCFTPGSRINNPLWEKTIYISNTERGRYFAFTCYGTACRYIESMKYVHGNKYVITV